MNRHILANIVDDKMQSLIAAGYRTSQPIEIHLIHPEISFLFDWVITNDEYASYDYKNADVVNAYTERLYPNICHFLCKELDSLFGNVNRENQCEYFESLTGRALRQARREHE